jgi:hypothetical protein
MKTNHLLVAVTLVGSVLILSSCGPTLYSTVGQNVPLFHQKGEGALSVGFMSASNDGYALNPANIIIDGEGINLQAALAVDSNVAIFSSFHSMNVSGDWEVKGNYFEIGGGLFKHNTETNLIGELFAGIGFGGLRSSSDGEAIHAKCIKYFIQPSGGFSTKVFDMAFTPRFGIVNYISHSGTDAPEVEEFFQEKKITFVVEPGLTIRVGFKNVKLQYQMNYTTFSFSSSNEDFDPVADFYGSIGLFFQITNRWKDH